MELFQRRLRESPAPDVVGRLAALEDYVEYLRQQGEYGLSQAGGRPNAPSTPQDAP